MEEQDDIYLSSEDYEDTAEEKVDDQSLGTEIYESLSSVYSSKHVKIQIEDSLHEVQIDCNFQEVEDGETENLTIEEEIPMLRQNDSVRNLNVVVWLIGCVGILSGPCALYLSDKIYDRSYLSLNFTYLFLVANVYLLLGQWFKRWPFHLLFIYISVVVSLFLLALTTISMYGIIRYGFKGEIRANICRVLQLIYLAGTMFTVHCFVRYSRQELKLEKNDDNEKTKCRIGCLTLLITETLPVCFFFYKWMVSGESFDAFVWIIYFAFVFVHASIFIVILIVQQKKNTSLRPMFIYLSVDIMISFLCNISVFCVFLLDPHATRQQIFQGTILPLGYIFVTYKFVRQFKKLSKSIERQSVDNYGLNVYPNQSFVLNELIWLIGIVGFVSGLYLFNFLTNDFIIPNCYYWSSLFVFVFWSGSIILLMGQKFNRWAFYLLYIFISIITSFYLLIITGILLLEEIGRNFTLVFVFAVLIIYLAVSAYIVYRALQNFQNKVKYSKKELKENVLILLILTLSSVFFLAYFINSVSAPLLNVYSWPSILLVIYLSLCTVVIVFQMINPTMSYLFPIYLSIVAISYLAILSYSFYSSFIIYSLGGTEQVICKIVMISVQSFATFLFARQFKKCFQLFERVKIDDFKQDLKMFCENCMDFNLNPLIWVDGVVGIILSALILYLWSEIRIGKNYLFKDFFIAVPIAHLFGSIFLLVGQCSRKSMFYRFNIWINVLTTVFLTVIVGYLTVSVIKFREFPQEMILFTGAHVLGIIYLIATSLTVYFFVRRFQGKISFKERK